MRGKAGFAVGAADWGQAFIPSTVWRVRLGNRGDGVGSGRGKALGCGELGVFWGGVNGAPGSWRKLDDIDVGRSAVEAV